MIIQGVTLSGTNVFDGSIITNNLAIWIDANNSTSYNGSGTTITDLSGNSRTQNLTIASQYTMLNGVKCFDCTTSGNFIQASSASPVLPTSGFTYIVWARMISSSAGWRTLLRANPNDHPILIELGTNNLGMYDNTINAFFTAGYSVSGLADTWVQWAVTGDSSGQTFYINGVQVGTSIQTSAGNSHNYLGGIAGQAFGYVANMELYTSILTSNQILQNYYSQLAKFSLANIVTSNLVLWYDPSFSTSYSGSGTSIYNLANTSLTGTMSNITYISPYFAYNGSTSQVNIPDNALLEPSSGNWTMEVWVKQTNNSGSQVILGKFDPGGASQDVSYSIRTSGSTLFAQFGDGTGAYINSTSYSLPLSTWKQIVYVWKTGATKTVETYVNGVSIGSVNHTLNSLLNTPANLYLGSYNGGEYAQYYNGQIGVTRLYNTALTSANVLQNFNADRSKYGI